MSKKLRVGGMTVDATKTYSGDVVLELIEASFENGCRRGTVDSEKEFQRGYEIGYADGKEAVGRTLKKLREALNDVLEQDGRKG